MSHHILVVEDDEMIQSFLALHLEHEGYRVSAVSTGKDMLDTFYAESIDLILLDLNLPDQNGLTLAESIRETSTVPIIIATASKEQLTKLTAFNLGANDYITKPYDPLELMARIRNALGGPEPMAQPNPSAPLAVSQHQKPEPALDSAREISVQKRRTKIYGAIAAASIVGLLILVAVTIGPNIFGAGADMAVKKPTPTTAVNPPIAARPPTAANPPTVAPPPQTVAKPTPVGNYQWVAKANCPEVPDVAWWVNKTHLKIAKYVDTRYRGDWAAYIEFWENEKEKIAGISSRGNMAVINKNTSLKGEDLVRFIKLLEIRVAVLRCLANAPKN